VFAGLSLCVAWMCRRRLLLLVLVGSMVWFLMLRMV
jgi:hypothetical protein